MGLRTSINIRVGRALGKTGRAVALLTRNRIHSHGVVVDTTSPLITDETRAGLFWGYYEAAERRAALRFLRADAPTIELGASIGFLSVLIAKHVAPQFQVAIEANPALIPILRENLRQNGADRVEVVAAAVAYGADCAAFSPVVDTASGRLAANGSTSDLVSVPTTSLRQILTRAPPGPFALVCDIEGAEYELFSKEPESVRARCQLAVMELHEITREGIHYSRKALGDWLGSQWKMKTLFSDGKVWVFGR